MTLETLPFVPCNHRTARAVTDLVVIHTNEGPEGTQGAEGLAAYLRTVDPGYNVVVDQDSAVRTAGDHEAVWGAGGVNARAWHLCLVGFSAQSAAEWADAASTSELELAAQLVREACDLLGVPKTRTVDSRPGNRGICGHVDVSRYYMASMGHTDPGDGFPWDHFLALVNGAPTNGDNDMTNDEHNALMETVTRVRDLEAFVAELKSEDAKPHDPPHVGAMRKLNNVHQFLADWKNKIIAKLGA